MVTDSLLVDKPGPRCLLQGSPAAWHVVRIWFFSNYWCDGFNIAGGHVFLVTPSALLAKSQLFPFGAHKSCTLPLSGVSHCSRLAHNFCPLAKLRHLSPLEVEKLVGSYSLSFESLGNEERVGDSAYPMVLPCPIGSGYGKGPLVFRNVLIMRSIHMVQHTCKFQKSYVQASIHLDWSLGCRKCSVTKFWLPQILPLLVYFSLHNLLFTPPVAWLGVG